MELKIIPFPLRETTKRLDRLKRKQDLLSLSIDVPPPQPIEPISSAHGQIKVLLLAFPKENDAKRRYGYLQLLHELVTKMTEVESIILIHRKNLPKEEIKKYLQQKDVRLFPLEIDVALILDIWVQDHFYPLYSKGQEDIITFAVGRSPKNIRRTLCEVTPLIDKKVDENGIPIFQEKIQLKKTALPFEGGNILVGDNFILVGKDDKQVSTISSEAECNSLYKKWFGQVPLFVGTNNITPTPNAQKSKDGFENTLPNKKLFFQPLFHIDTFISLGGWSEKEPKEYLLFVGEPVLGVRGIKNEDPKLFNYINDYIETKKKEINATIDNLKDQVARRQDLSFEFKIIRNPLVLTYNDRVKKDEIEVKRKWFWVSYNNNLSEIFEDQEGNLIKRVWLPSYGQPSSDFSNQIENLDEIKERLFLLNPLWANKKITYGNWTDLAEFDCQSVNRWTSNGFEVQLLDSSYIPLAFKHGALNCISNCIQRC